MNVFLTSSTAALRHLVERSHSAFPAKCPLAKKQTIEYVNRHIHTQSREGERERVENVYTSRESC